MQYENRQPAESINVTRQSPLKQFFKLLLAAAVLIVLIAVVLQVSGGWLGKRIPFKLELAIMQELDVEFSSGSRTEKINTYLNELSARVAAHMDLPEGMSVRVHYNQDDVFNAFATIGGNLIFYKGLLEQLPDENSLALVMAHEMAHVKHRDPMASLGGGVASTVALMALTGSTGSNLAGNVLGNAGVLTRVQFTRSMEEQADRAALSALHAMYGHINGATGVFEKFKLAGESRNAAVDYFERFLRTHPLGQDRMDSVNERAQKEGWLADGAITPLPNDFTDWL